MGCFELQARRRPGMGARVMYLAMAMVLVLAGGIAGQSAYAQCNPQQLFKSLPDVDAEGDYFGSSVAIDGTTFIVGAFSDDDDIMGTDVGSAYLFDTSTGAMIAKLLPLDGAQDDHFGWSVAISAATAIAGAYGDDDNGNASGSAYLFDAVTGLQLAKLLPADGAAGDYFGYAAAVDGTTAIVGAYQDDDNGTDSGSAYLFDSTTGAQLAKLLPLDGEEYDYFGTSVAISGSTAIIGATGDDDGGAECGSAYLFDTVTGNQTAKLLPADGSTDDQFGSTVAVSATTALVGAFGDDDFGSASGAAYLFDSTTGAQSAKLVPADGAAYDFFGWAVAIDGTNAIIGAFSDDDHGFDSGSAYLFDTCAQTGTISAAYTCLPAGGTVPFATRMTVTLDNLYSGQTRRIAGRINVSLAGGTSYSSWRAGFTNVAGGGSFTTAWYQTIPALGAVIGANLFELAAEDVTPAPYNQPPYPPAGDTATASCTVTGLAP